MTYLFLWKPTAAGQVVVPFVVSNGQVGVTQMVRFTVMSCVVLSAAYGRADAPEIQALLALHHRLVPGRAWNASWHQACLRWYGQVGPRLSAHVQRRPWLQALIRAVLRPLVELESL